jgi:AraC-like DNA-binding protein
MSMIQFIAPAMPHYITSGEDTYLAGGIHPARNKIGVFDLIIVVRGTLDLVEKEMVYHVNEGHYLLLLPDRSHHSLHPCDKETYFYWLHFQTLGTWSEVTEQSSFIQPSQKDAFSQIEHFSFYIPQFGELRVPSEIYALMHQLNLLIHQQMSSDRWKQQVLFQELLLKLTEGNRTLKETSHIVVAEKAAAFLRQNYRNPITYIELANALHFHQNYIALCMKRVFGCTPLEYVTRYRIEQAKHMLIHTNEAVGKIVEESGFGSFPFFIRSFTKHTGYRPKAYRNRFRS